jgi:hypothetical protein
MEGMQPVIQTIQFIRIRRLLRRVIIRAILRSVLIRPRRRIQGSKVTESG